MFKGSIVALATPFKNDQVDKERLLKLVEFHIQEGTDGIVPCGTTGESATLSHEEHKEVVTRVVEAVNKRIPVIAGAGSNCTRESVELARHAKKVGADAILAVTPYYNKPTQEGLYAHYAAIANEVDIPLIPYNVPGRTGVNLLPETVARLAMIDNIVGIKEASADLRQQSKIVELCRHDFALLSGDDFTLLPTLSIGGVGVISVVANIIPKDVANLVREFNKGNFEEAKKLHYKIFPICEAMFIETNPVPVKEALGMMGMILPEVRLPLVPLRDTNREKVQEVLHTYGLV
ncbi:MAG: 4-hydroxy-tetrahydrodipicolinate synthase [bacterium]|nr:4-hydroxy-tetrahydrodipicolinate synthase [bacterium]